MKARVIARWAFADRRTDDSNDMSERADASLVEVPCIPRDVIDQTMAQEHLKYARFRKSQAPSSNEPEMACSSRYNQSTTGFRRCDDSADCAAHVFPSLISRAHPDGGGRKGPYENAQSHRPGSTASCTPSRTVLDDDDDDDEGDRTKTSWKRQHHQPDQRQCQDQPQNGHRASIDQTQRCAVQARNAEQTGTRRQRSVWNDTTAKIVATVIVLALLALAIAFVTRQWMASGPTRMDWMDRDERQAESHHLHSGSSALFDRPSSKGSGAVTAAAPAATPN